MLKVKIWCVDDSGEEWFRYFEAEDWEEVNEVMRQMVIASDGELQITGVEEIV